MKNFNFFKWVKYTPFAVLVLCLTVFVACQKELGFTPLNEETQNSDIFPKKESNRANKSATSSNNLAQSSSELWLLDGENVDAKSFGVDDDNLLVAITDTILDGQLTLCINGFSSRSGFESFGDSKGLEFSKNLEIADHLSQYAAANGVIDIYEDKGEVPQFYSDYEAQYLASMGRNLNGFQSPESVISFTAMYDECLSGSIYPLGFLRLNPVLPGWSNKISQVQFVPQIVRAGFTMFDRTFYRRHLVTLGFRWGWTKYCLPVESVLLDNRAESIIQ
jgi:hypothetical protein